MATGGWSRRGKSYSLFRQKREAAVCSGLTSDLLCPPPLSSPPSVPVTLEQGGSARCVPAVFQEEPEEPGSQRGPCPGEAALHGRLARVSQLELWLQKAQRSLLAAASSTMQDGVEQQLLTCQVSPAP